jgi:hypothetical protein
MQPIRALFVIVLLSTTIAGCGQTPEPAPPTVPATSPPNPAVISTAATAEAPGLTFGELAARISAAWPTVKSYRAVFTSEALAAPTPPAAPVASPVASPVATPAATPVARAKQTFVFDREVVLPDQQRQAVSGIGANDHEAIFTGGRLFIRGPLTDLIAPGTPPETWIEIDPAEIPANSALSSLLGGLPQQPAAPLASLPERLWPQKLRDLGRVEFDGRDCQVYGAADTVTATGMRLDYSIAIDKRNIPCFIETSAAGALQGRDEYREIDSAVQITAPAAATPVSVPATLATPVPGD